MNWAKIFIVIMNTHHTPLELLDWRELLNTLDNELSQAIERIIPNAQFSEELEGFLSTELSLPETNNIPAITYANFNEFSAAKNNITSFPKLHASIQKQELSILKKQMRFLFEQNQFLTLKMEQLSQDHAALKKELIDTKAELTQLKSEIFFQEDARIEPIIKINKLDELIQKKINLLGMPSIDNRTIYTNEDFFNYQEKMLALNQEILICLSGLKMNLDQEKVKFNSNLSDNTTINLNLIKIVLNILFNRLQIIFLVKMMFSSKKIDDDNREPFKINELNRLIDRFNEAALIQEKNNEKVISTILNDIATLLKELTIVHNAIVNCILTFDVKSKFELLTKEQFDYLGRQEPSTTKMYDQLVNAITIRSKEITVIVHEDPVMYSKNLLKTELETLILQLKLNPSHHSTGQAVAKLSGEAAAAFIPVVGSFVNTAVGLSINLSQERDKNQNIQHMRGLTDDIIRDALNLLIESLSLWAPQIHLLARAHRVSQENIRGQKNEFTQKLSCFFHQAKETLLKKQALSYPPYVDFIRLITEMVKMYFNTRETIVGVSVNAKSLYQEIICHLFTCEITLFDQLSKILNFNLIAVPVSENAFQEISLDKLLQGCPLQDEFGACYLIQKADGKFITQEACYHFPLSTNSKTQLSYILAAQNFSIIPKHFLDSGNDIYR